MRIMCLARLSATGAAIAVAVAAATGAWACFPLPMLTVSPRASGPVGTQVTVDGVDFGESVETEIRWNAVDGPLLGRGSTGRFSVPVTIPPADDGTYSIVALSRLLDDSVGVKAATTFQVTSGAVTGSSPSTSGPVSGERSSSTSTTLSSTATAILVLAGGVLFVAGAAGGAFLSRRRMTTPTS